MSTGTIFFSYSRDNTEFVMDLAKELRQAGADVWLDQMDIKPGSRWDKSIENALVKSQTLLVILSKSSVESNNVMDEVSFALEEGKTIVPVLFEECDIPFRLRSLQFADFTKDHTKGIKTLVDALDLHKNVASKLSAKLVKETEAVKPQQNIPVIEKKKSVKEAVSIESVKEEKKPKKNKKSKSKANPKPKTKYKILIISSIIVGVVSLLLWQFSDRIKDEVDWNKIKNSKSLESLEAHLKTYNNCVHFEKVNSKIDLLKDNSDWEKIKNSTSLEDFDKYLEAFPNGSHTKAAKAKLTQITAVNKENTFWKIILDEFSETSFNNYLTNYPTGIYKRQADSILVVLKEANNPQNDIDDWNNIKNKTDKILFENHLKIFTICVHKNDIKKILKKLNKDADYWNKISSKTNSKDYLGYLLEIGSKAIHYNEAKENIYKYAKDNPIGYVYIGELASNNQNFKSGIAFVNVLNKTTIYQKLNIGDIIQSKRGAKIRDANSASRSSVIGTIYANQPVVVLEVIYVSSKYCWVRIAKI